jgi:hypothetical protein
MARVAINGLGRIGRATLKIEDWWRLMSLTVSKCSSGFHIEMNVERADRRPSVYVRANHFSSGSSAWPLKPWRWTICCPSGDHAY